MITSNDLEKPPEILEGTVLTEEDLALFGENAPSWATVNKILTQFEGEDRVEMTKKALLLELFDKRRDYETYRLTAYIVQAHTAEMRATTMRQIGDCIDAN
jgi:hypothetical protein